MKKNIGFGAFFLLVSMTLMGCSQEAKPQPIATSTAKVVSEAALVSGETAGAYAEDLLENMSLDEKIGQIFLVNLELLDTTKGSYYNFVKINDIMKATMNTYPVGGVILSSRNIETKDQLSKLMNALDGASKSTPLYFATNEEGGTSNSIFYDNSNLRGTVFPSSRDWSRIKSVDETVQRGRITGSELKALGFNLNFAPVADVADKKSNILYSDRCFSEDSEVVSNYVASMVKGMSQSGMGTILTHFPGIGSAKEDVSETMVNNESTLTKMRSDDFPPFEAGIDAGANFVMVSNISVSRITESTIPASLSKVFYKDILRNELSFDGIILTDALNTPVITNAYTADKAAVLAINAGATMIMSPENLQMAFDGIRQSIYNKAIDEKILNSAVIKILKDKIERGIIKIPEETPAPDITPVPEGTPVPTVK